MLLIHPNNQKDPSKSETSTIFSLIRLEYDSIQPCLLLPIARKNLVIEVSRQRLHGERYNVCDTIATIEDNKHKRTKLILPILEPLVVLVELAVVLLTVVVVAIPATVVVLVVEPLVVLAVVIVRFGKGHKLASAIGTQMEVGQQLFGIQTLMFDVQRVPLMHDSNTEHRTCGAQTIVLADVSNW